MQQRSPVKQILNAGMNNMKKIAKTMSLPVIGFGVVLVGFFYEVLFAGIPYQDPTPELQARYDFHGAVAGWFYKTGGIALLLGVVAIPFILKRTKKSKFQKSSVDV